MSHVFSKMEKSIITRSVCEEKYTSTGCMSEMITSTKVH
jgi:hypothetical protein